jgi:ferritin-like metal-binding protein YciE
MDTLRALFEDTLKDVYYAEHAIVKSLPKMIKSSSAETLQTAFSEHLKETKVQIERLESVFNIIGVKPSSKVCHAIKGLIEEGDELIAEKPEATILDAGLLACAQAIEHYEMARYGTLRAWADQLGLNVAAMLLQQTLAEEKSADAKLSVLALSAINEHADAGDEGVELHNATAALDKNGAGSRKSGPDRTKSA